MTFEQPSYTVPVTNDNITLGINVNQTLDATIILEVNTIGIEGVTSSGMNIINEAMKLCI